jgi:tetratricopeptide (TPR) repeat protein
MRTLFRAIFPLVATLSFTCSLRAGEEIKAAVVNGVIEVSGGGRQPWTLRYGLTAQFPDTSDSDEVHIAAAGADHAYFSHGAWLRWLDTKRGVVIGRWMLPGRITKLVSQGELAIVDITEDSSAQIFNRTFTIDPNHPEIPAGSVQNLLLYRTAQCEVVISTLSRNKSICGLLGMSRVADRDHARAAVPELQAAVRRDPVSPWYRVVLGKVMFDAGDPDADAAIDDALNLPMRCAELLPISAFLEEYKFHEAADKAFERGYGDLLASGNDPRLVGGILVRLLLFPIDVEKADPSRRMLLVERIYRLNPYAESSDLAWKSFAMAAKSPKERKLWQGRAQESRQNGTSIFSDLGFQSDVFMLILIACGFAKFWYAVISYVRYRPQRFFDKNAAKQTHVSRWRRFPYLNVQYWSVAQRVSFILLFVIAWFGVGWYRQSMFGVLLVGERPIEGMGNFAGPSMQWFLQNRLPDTPERNFLLGLSFAQGGDREKAAQMYQQAPAYSQSWNNLGAIRRIQGREPEAVDAFQHALRIDPSLAEAALNLGRGPSDYWTRIHQEYIPNAPMIASPPKRLVMTAFLGATTTERLRSAWKDALGPANFDFESLKTLPRATKSPTIAPALMGSAALLMILLFLVPYLLIQQKPGIGGNILGILFPGTSRNWGVAGAPILLAWGYFAIQLLLLSKGSPYFMTYIGATNLMRTYGAPETHVGRLINPAWWWLYLVPALLFCANYLVMRSERKGTQEQRLPTVAFQPGD